MFHGQLPVTMIFLLGAMIDIVIAGCAPQYFKYTGSLADTRLLYIPPGVNMHLPAHLAIPTFQQWTRGISGGCGASRINAGESWRLYTSR